jgi:hypothetical protein
MWFRWSVAAHIERLMAAYVSLTGDFARKFAFAFREARSGKGRYART